MSGVVKHTELHKRSSALKKLKTEEKQLLQMIAETKEQLTQLQVEAINIKAKIHAPTEPGASTSHQDNASKQS